MDTIARVEELAEERNLTLYEVSQLAGLNYSTIKNTKLRNGQLKVDTIEKICIGLGIPMPEFFSVDS